MRFITLESFLSKTLGEASLPIRKAMWRRMEQKMGRHMADWLMKEWTDKPLWACIHTTVADFKGCCWII